MRYVEKSKLAELVANHAYDKIAKEVIDFWVKMYGQDISIPVEPTPRADAKNDDKDDAKVNGNSDGAQKNEDNKVDEKEES